MPQGAAQIGKISVVVEQLDEQIKWLEKDLADNLKLAGIIILQIKAIFVKERAKFEVAEPQPGQQNLALQVKPREIRVNTSSAGSGDNYEHPRKLDYNNPIETI